MHLRQACVPLALLTLASACADRAGRDVPTASTAPDAAPRFALGPSALGPPVPVGVEVVATGFTSPVQLVTAPQKNGRRFVVDQVGVVWELNPAGKVMPKPFLDVSSRITPLSPGYDERGLLGLAFHPDFGRNGRFFVFYTIPPRAGAPAGFNHTNVISEFRARGGSQLQADPGSERVVLMVDHPQANHNGGTLAFGPDGYLYISIGDGGNRDDEGLGHVEDWYADNAGGNAQDVTQNLLGNILRIDVDRGAPYAVPSSNPFVGRTGLDEIWAYGFRNPYRFSFDMENGHRLLVGDAGQELWEEVSEVVKGGNYGWNVREGTHCFDAENPTVSPATCPDEDPVTGEELRDPVIEFANTKNGGLSLTVVGGVVYRGDDVPQLDGRYVFGGAFSGGGISGRLFVATPQGSGLWPMQELLVNGTERLGHVVKGFGQDADGEVYVTGSEVLGPTGTTGKVFRLVRPRG
jgi:glucose/arabinose dehydrogenase